MRSPIPIQDRFWPKVKVLGEEECWEWTGARDVRGYGRLMVGGRGGRPVGAHRISYELERGEIPPGLMVLHSCDNPGCVNPSHLSLGTQRENMQQASERKRCPGQEKTHCVQGHPFSGDNLIITKRGQRRCRECNRASMRGRYAAWRNRAVESEAALDRIYYALGDRSGPVASEIREIIMGVRENSKKEKEKE